MTLALVAAVTLCFEVAPRLDGEPFRKNTMANGQHSLRMPGATARDIALSRITDEPGSLFHESLHLDDAYQNQTYWADLPRKEQVNWIIG